MSTHRDWHEAAFDMIDPPSDHNESQTDTLVQSAINFLQTIPTYSVIWRVSVADQRQSTGMIGFTTTHVAENDLEAFLRVLRMNGCEDYHVVKNVVKNPRHPTGITQVDFGASEAIGIGGTISQ